ncbi:MAG: molybdopterin-dependent oxidoreductase [Planctomycetales bacterium]|nr:molybdopterin-dependent oxidoreductase [Planctomycetales bacterium]MCA9167646.1 molybdopterin-dependent oxidoreductase [Planctomycetales bacterium]
MTTLRTACNRDCPDACEILATIEDGRVTHLRGAPDHPVTQGFLCERTSRFLERQYAADRLTTPLIRRGEEFEPATWDEALDLIAAKFTAACEEYGPASLMAYRCGGSLGMMKHVTDHFFRQFGSVTKTRGDVCSGAGEHAQNLDFGISNSSDLFDLYNSRTIVLWGKNPYVSSVHLLPILREANTRGTRIILIDPVQHRTARLADISVQPRPGGDAAIACGIALWLYQHERHDASAADYCDNWPAYLELLQSQTLAEWASAADITVAQLEEVAATYADGPSAILVGWGMQRREHGCATVRAIDALAAMSGNLGVAGGGASFYFQRRAAFDLSFAADDPPVARTIPEPLLGDGILSAADPPIRCLWISAANPVAMLPDSARVAEALRTRELTVVVDAFLTDSARCAHVVLPTTTFLEEDDLVGAYGHHYVANQAAVTSAPREVRSDYHILQALAPKLGWHDRFRDDVNTWKQRLLAKMAPAGITLERLAAQAQRNPDAPQILFADRRFPTRTGRVNLVTQLDSALTCRPQTGLLRLAALSSARAQGSQWTDAQQQHHLLARVHPTALGACHDGQLANLTTERGQLCVVVKVDADVHPEMIVVDKGGWMHRGNCANELIGGQLTDAGEGAVYYDTIASLTPYSE